MCVEGSPFVCSVYNNNSIVVNNIPAQTLLEKPVTFGSQSISLPLFIDVATKRYDRHKEIWRQTVRQTHSDIQPHSLQCLIKKLINYYYVVFSATSPKICCHITFQNLGVRLWIVKLYRIVIQFRNDVKSFIYSKYPQRCHLDRMSVPFNLQYYSLCSKCLPSAHMRAFSRARLLSMDASMMHCSMLCQALTRAVEFIALMLRQTTVEVK